MSRNKGKHVVPRQNGWAVKSAGASKAAKVFNTKDEAVKYARDSAKKDNGELYVHRKDGTIGERKSYGNEPCPPKDKK